MDHNKLQKILQDMGILDYLTCLLRNLYAGKEATVRTGHGRPLPLPLGFLGIQPAHHLRRMLTIQNPKKSWLAMKPDCSLVDNAPLGP